MPSAVGVNNGPPPKDQETGEDATASLHDGSPVLVSPAATSGAMEAGRRRGRNEDEEEDDEENERATKQQGVGSPMRTATGSSRKDPKESPLRVEEVGMSLDGIEGSSNGKPPGGSILRKKASYK